MNNSLTDPSVSEKQVPFPALLAILSVMSLGTICGNVLVLLSIWTQASLQRPTYVPIGSLALADLLAGVFAMPAYLIKKSPLDLGEFWEGIVCDVFRFSYFLSGYASIVSLTVISVDRMLTIRNPLSHHRLVTHRRVVMFSLIAWMDACLVSMLPFFPLGGPRGRGCYYNPTSWWSLMVIGTNVVIPFLLILLCYIDMYCTARNHLRKIRSEQSYNRQVAQYRRHEGKATRTITIVIGLFILSWFPSCIYYFLKEVCDVCFPSSFAPLEGIFNSLVKLLTFSGALWNPLIYCWRSVEFRTAFLRILTRGRVRMRRESISMATRRQTHMNTADSN